MKIEYGVGLRSREKANSIWMGGAIGKWESRYVVLKVKYYYCILYCLPRSGHDLKLDVVELEYITNNTRMISPAFN